MDLAGTAADRAFQVGTFTRWGRNPWTEGSYASARPGGLIARADLGRPVANRLYFAGDACHPVGSSSVGRALETGVMAAERLAGNLGRLPA